MRRLAVASVLAVLASALIAAAATAKQPTSTFVVVLNAANEVPLCAPATKAARGVATFRVTNETMGTVEYKLVANNIPGNTTAAHIHEAVAGTPGLIVQALAFTPGAENGVIGKGSFTNRALLVAIRANPSGYYVNVHSTVCGGGVIRGQFGGQRP